MLSNVTISKSVYYPFYTNANKCGETCNTDDDPYGRECVPNKIKYERESIWFDVNI